MVENVTATKNAGETRKPLIPVELTEANWRFWSFILLALIAIYLMTEFQVPVVQGLTDPFYSPTILVLPLVAGFRATCYAYRKDYHRHLFNHPNACNTDVRKDFKGRKYTGETRLFRLENYHRYKRFSCFTCIFCCCYIFNHYFTTFSFLLFLLLIIIAMGSYLRSAALSFS